MSLDRSTYTPRSTSRAAAVFLLGTVVVLTALILLPAFLGFQRYPITNDSMDGTYDRGSLVYDDVVPTASLRVGDVITYQPPPAAGPGGRITHRIYSIGRDRRGPVYRTKGDANRAPDPWQFTLSRPTQARVVFHVPYAGYLFEVLSVRAVQLLVVGLPALLVAFSLLAGLRRAAGGGAGRRRTGDLVLGED